MQRRVPRLVLAGTNSGCGKTTVTCAVLQALVAAGSAGRRGEMRPGLHRPHVPQPGHRREKL